jgi:hypothetical protein
MTTCDGRSPSTAPYLRAYGGAWVAVPWPAANRYDSSPVLRGGTHDLAAGGSVRDRQGVSRRWVLGWPAVTDDNLHVLRRVTRRPGPWRWLDPFEVNRLTANQSDGTDDLGDPTGHRAVGQGTVTSTVAQAHEGVRSLLWDSDTALSSTGRGVAYATAATLDATWTAVRPSLAYTFSVWGRCSVAVTMQPRIDWYDTTGASISSDTGTATALSTSAWTQLSCVNKTSPAAAAYAVAGVLNTTTTGAATEVYLDDAQLEEGATVTTWRQGAGTPLVTVDQWAERMLRFGLREAELSLLELSA